MIGDIAEKFSKVVIHVFGDYESLKQFVLFRFLFNLNEIVSDKSLENAVFELIKWAEQEGQVKELVQKVVNEKPKNLKVKEFLSLINIFQNKPVKENNKETTTEKKKILFIYSNFEHATQIRVGSELNKIENCFGLIENVKRDDFYVQTRPQMQPKDVVDAIKAEPVPYLVHISVHGKKGEGLVFNSSANTEIIINQDAVNLWFIQLKRANILPECILINGCHSEEIIKKNSWQC
ncbi:MAG: hypothetical protein HC831_10185 [Chloroflexia bacterium]|nr:hypothetical protein [Chloroflexia bacterium]